MVAIRLRRRHMSTPTASLVRRTTQSKQRSFLLFNNPKENEHDMQYT
jgi:hypothetical protein